MWCKGRALIGRGDGEGERSSVVRQRQRLRQRTGIPVATIDDRPDSELERTPSRSTRLNSGHVPNGACHTSHAACFAQVGPPHVMRCVTGGIRGLHLICAEGGISRGAEMGRQSYDSPRTGVQAALRVTRNARRMMHEK